MSYSPIERMDTKLSGISRRSTFYPNPFRRISSRWWFWELTSITITLVSFLAIIITLRVFDGKPLPEIPFGITLNTIASLLGTAVKTTLLLVVSSALSQLKWLWFHEKERRLQDLQVYDEASRGPWGAMVLLRTSKFSLASLGALIVLFLLGFDPFIQQLITTPQKTILTSEKSTALPRATAFNQSALFKAYNNANFSTSADLNARLMGKDASIGIKIAVANGVNSQQPLPAFTPFCPSSNCTWPVFSSLGLCSTCTDVTDYTQENSNCQAVNKTKRACTYKLPNSQFSYTYFAITSNSSAGIDIEGSGELRQRIWATRLDQTTSTKNAFQRISRVLMDDGNGTIVPGPSRERVREATECTLSMCVIQHSLSVEQGITVHRQIGITEEPFKTKIVLSNKLTNTTEYDVSPATIQGQQYTVDGADTLDALAGALETTLPGNVTADIANITSATGKKTFDGSTVPSSDLSNFFYTELNFTTAMDNIATSVSSYMRSLSNDTVTGQSQSIETNIRVKWAWISFPAALVFGGVLLLLFAISETSKKGVEVWKYSCLPLLFHSVNEGNARRIDDITKRQMSTVEEMEDEAKRIWVRLGREGESGAWGLQREWRDRGLR